MNLINDQEAIKFDETDANVCKFYNEVDFQESVNNEDSLMQKVEEFEATDN